MTTDMQYDNQLWFKHQGCEGKHFLIGNPHTFKGRMWAWCPVKQRTFFVSRSEMGEQSSETKYWIEGFLHGNEPDPPRNKDGDVDFDSENYRLWQKQCEEFRSKGHWVHADQEDGEHKSHTEAEQDDAPKPWPAVDSKAHLKLKPELGIEARLPIRVG